MKKNKQWLVSLLATLALLHGCGGDTGDVDVEVTTATVANPCQNIYDLCINPILRGPIGASNTSCASSSCHGSGGSGGAFVLFNTVTPVDLAFNFNSAKAFINPSSISQSKLLAEPLVGDSGVASVGSHGGGDNFSSSTNACYQEILAWAGTTEGTCPTTCAVLTASGPTAADLLNCAP
ncbi:MAG: hypothetical protein AAF372_01010 [Pseudomonadota bacterium]